MQPISAQDLAPKSYFDAVMSIDFDECSIASSDACGLAHRMIGNGSFDSLPTYLVDGFIDYDIDEPILKSEIQPLGSVDIETDLTDQKTVTIALERSVSLDGKKRPTLVAIINNDLMLPIAAFEDRAGTECSYVQLGQEIVDDNIVVSGREKRSEYVEAIRRLLEDRSSDKSQGLITDLVQRELEMYRDQAEALLMPSLCTLAESVFNNPEIKISQDIFELSKKDLAAMEQTVQLTLLAQGLELPSGRYVSFALISKSVAEAKRGRGLPESVSLHVRTRGDVTLELARFSAGKVFVQGPEGDFVLAGLGKLKLLRSFLKLDFEAINELRQRSPKLYQAVTTQTHAYQEILDKMIEGNRWSRPRHSNTDIKEAANKVEASKLKKLIKELDPYFAVDSGLTELLGKHSHDTEFVLGRIATLAANGGMVEGVMASEKVGKTYTDIFTIIRSAQSEPGTYRVKVEARPDSQPAFTPATIFDEIFHRTQPNDIEDQKIADIKRALEAINK